MAVRILTPYFLLGQDQVSLHSPCLGSSSFPPLPRSMLMFRSLQNFPTVDFDFRNSGVVNKRNAQADHAQIIRRIGAESNILLKHSNANVLPFTTTISGDANYTFAVIGSDAGRVSLLSFLPLISLYLLPSSLLICCRRTICWILRS